ncbi:MAG: class I SAM-dependent methyltransferase [Candidatus Algichlamydia australiensis]|nr:class I SAM-dependent methyltransferase [Chlamydiales bacterium]
MDPITLSEKEKYKKIWQDKRYRNSSPGYKLAKLFFYFAKNSKGESVTDFGCGTGRAALRFLGNGMHVQLVDITKNALDESIKTLCHIDERVSFIEASVWELPEEVVKTDWIFSADLLEHLPEERVDAALHNMASRTKKGGMLQIYLEEEPFGELIGETLHLTLKSRQWWIDQVAKHWEITLVSPEVQDHVRFAIFVGKPHEKNQTHK